jgi:glycosyltransferase involved in cell wall biosynthesis
LFPIQDNSGQRSAAILGIYAQQQIFSRACERVDRDAFERYVQRMNLLAYIHLRNIYRSTGVGRVSRELAEHLARHPEVNLRVLADRQDHAKFIHKVGSPWTEFPYALFDQDTSKQQLDWLLRQSPKAESFWPEADIVYCTAESYVPTRRAKLVVTCHDMQLFEPGAHAMSRSLLLQRAKWWFLFRVLARKADRFHTISSFSAQRMAHYFPAIRDRIKVVPNAVSAAFFEPPTAEGMKVLAELGLEGKPFVMLPGGLHFRKNAPLVLEAWPEIRRRCPELTLVVAGHNTPEFTERAQALPGVILTGFRDEAEFVALFQAATVVWFPSRYEGFGMPVLEAMACGAPVVASNSTAIPETAGGAAAALVAPDRPGEHAEAVAGLVRDEAGRARAARMGKERARQFTWDRSTDGLIASFRDLL